MIRLSIRTQLALLFLFLLLVAASAASIRSCSTDERSPAQAKADMVRSCAEGAAEDRPICRCIADGLQRRHGVDSTGEWEEVRQLYQRGRADRRVDGLTVECGATLRGAPAQEGTPTPEDAIPESIG